MTALELRRLDDENYPGFVRNLDRTFGFDYNPDEDTLKPVLELDRSFAHFDGDRIVSTISAFSLEMTVPGSVVRCGGTTVVTVSPTHRRRGLLKEMMDRHLSDVMAREEPIAALWASESEIYGRFGYGRATKTASLTIHRRAPAWSRHAPPPAAARLVELDEAREIVPPIHDGFRVGQPGMFKRSEPWWQTRVFKDLPSRRSGYTAARWAVVDGEGGPKGYVKYRVKSKPGDDGHFGNELLVIDLFGLTPEAWSGLWAYVLNQDLIATFSVRLRSEDDPLFDLLAGPRRAQAEVSDGLWVRVMDVPAALCRRSYQSEFAGVLEVHDPLGLAGGKFRLDAGPDGVECVPTDDRADIEMDIEDLGAVYMGRSGLRRMRRSGRVAGDDAVLRSADLALGWDPVPWCPEIF